MFKPTMKQVSDLIKIRDILHDFQNNYKENYDADDEIDASVNTMINLIVEGFDSVLLVAKARL